MTDDSYKMDFIDVRVPDLMNLVETLGLALGLHQAEDIAKCHRNIVDVRYSPLTERLEETRNRFDGYVKDYWADRGRAQAQREIDEDDEAADDLPEIDPDAAPLGSIDDSYKAPPMDFEDDE